MGALIAHYKAKHEPAASLGEETRASFLAELEDLKGEQDHSKKEADKQRAAKNRETANGIETRWKSHWKHCEKDLIEACKGDLCRRKLRMGLLAYPPVPQLPDPDFFVKPPACVPVMDGDAPARPPIGPFIHGDLSDYTPVTKPCGQPEKGEAVDENEVYHDLLTNLDESRWGCGDAATVLSNLKNHLISNQSAKQAPNLEYENALNPPSLFFTVPGIAWYLSGTKSVDAHTRSTTPAAQAATHGDKNTVAKLELFLKVHGTSIKGIQSAWHKLAHLDADKLGKDDFDRREIQTLTAAIWTRVSDAAFWQDKWAGGPSHLEYVHKSGRSILEMAKAWEKWDAEARTVNFPSPMCLGKSVPPTATHSLRLYKEYVLAPKSHPVNFYEEAVDSWLAAIQQSPGSADDRQNGEAWTAAKAAYARIANAVQAAERSIAQEDKTKTFDEFSAFIAHERDLEMAPMPFLCLVDHYFLSEYCREFVKQAILDAIKIFGSIIGVDEDLAMAFAQALAWMATYQAIQAFLERGWVFPHAELEQTKKRIHRLQFKHDLSLKHEMEPYDDSREWLARKDIPHQEDLELEDKREAWRIPLENRVGDADALFLSLSIGYGLIHRGADVDEEGDSQAMEVD
ncbi:uncharacterized protein PpBr36_11081 [Pyricularia pennisetigena]|uniref:uncharacterized protein n=1 Tax=Pyricularia pennisetigena TaxID=1578925 RepID=UPI001153A38E|nr:uncharacterized protein PpBr36_11081 [Pyricularia pennisetigena]TLS20645.1 hypothetical protein PpBr36_11081 [Pyricularia pennisetigena]